MTDLFNESESNLEKFKKELELLIPTLNDRLLKLEEELTSVIRVKKTLPL